MAAAFRPVNSSLIAQTISEDSPPGAAMAPHDAAPRRASFAGQKPLPSSPFPQAVQVPDAADRLPSDASQHSATTMDVDMDESDADAANDDAAASDDDSVNADGSRSTKKKKSQRFYCTDYPPCNLSFTRSEHLARHIRKHTGERPFQCHCSRRFSRLDNLRQHAQTVHVNEDIPIDSLAATGSRFQRQIRTDRVRQAGNRARASTGGSAGGPARGHSKSLSTSSIASISSVASSSYGSQGPDARRRPPPLVMAADARSRLSLESYRAAVDSPYPYRPSSPADYSTPTSATFSTAQSSPRWPSGMASPTSSHSRSQSLYSTGSRTPGRRLSVPSGAKPFPPHVSGPARSPFGPGLLNSSHPAALSPANAAAAADDAWRRRTWHPDSRTLNGHPLSAVGSQSVRPNPPPPIANPSSAQSSFRLPGIESFDADPPVRRPVYQPAEAMQPEERRNLNMYDASLQRGLTRLDISRKTPPDSAGAWASEANKAVQAQAERVRQSPSVRFEDQLPPSHGSGRAMHQQTMSAPPGSGPKRHGWYHGPAPGGPAAPSVPAAHVDRMVHPNLTGFNGFPGREAPPPQQAERPANAESLRRLEALVAVATSEGSTATATAY